MHLSPATLALVAGIFLFAGGVKGLIGMGLPTVALAMLVNAMPLRDGVTLIVIPAVITNIWQAFSGGRGIALVRRFWSFLLLLCIGTWIGVGILAILLGLGLTAFIFDVTRDKLLQMAWFRRMYDWFLWARDWAHAQTEPIRQRLHRLKWLLKPQRAGRFLRRLMRLRRRAYRSPAA